VWWGVDLVVDFTASFACAGRLLRRSGSSICLQFHPGVSPLDPPRQTVMSSRTLVKEGWWALSPMQGRQAPQARCYWLAEISAGHRVAARSVFEQIAENGVAVGSHRRVCGLRWRAVGWSGA